MTPPDRIHLRDHVVSAEIGAFQSERGREQRLRFALTVDLRDPVSGAADEVDRILSYDVLVQAVEAALADRRYSLVETLAERIAAEVLAHPAAARIAVTVEKLDRGPGALGISITRERGAVDAASPALPAAEILVLAAPAAPPEGAVVVMPGSLAAPCPLRPERVAGRRIALLALDQAAWAISADLGLQIAETRTEIEAALRASQPVVWAPARLAADDPEAGETPADLAFWLAARLAARRILFALPPGADLPAPPSECEIAVGHAGVDD